jgi:hypothetical protein
MQRNVVVALLILVILSSTMVTGCTTIVFTLGAIGFEFFGSIFLQRIFEWIGGGGQPAQAEAIVAPASCIALA